MVYVRSHAPTVTGIVLAISFRSEVSVATLWQHRRSWKPILSESCETSQKENVGMFSFMLSFGWLHDKAKTGSLYTFPFRWILQQHCSLHSPDRLGGTNDT